jgi:hypothetical protein
MNYTGIERRRERWGGAGEMWEKDEGVLEGEKGWGCDGVVMGL